MTLPPIRKVKRESIRILKKTLAIPRKMQRKYLTTPFYDIFQRHQVKTFEGHLQPGRKVAVYLIFPTKGLLPSHKLAIENIKKSGYAPFVVSNLPFTNNDCDWLTENTYKFMMRPNIGYDFGGYRDAFLSLDKELGNLEYLAFFNDSTWFPIPNSKDWLPQAEALNVGYASAASSFGIPPVKFENFPKIDWRFDVKTRNFHYCSYALLVRNEILVSKAFWRYWKLLPLLDEKNDVVRVGEIGLTKFVLRKGFSHGATYELSTLRDELNGCSNEQLNHIVQNLITLGINEARQLVTQVAPMLDARRSTSERQNIVSLILTIASRIGVTYVLPELLHVNHGFSFLKKSPVGICERDSDVMIAFGKSLHGETGKIILNEMSNIRKSKGITCDTDIAAKTSMNPS